MQYDFIALTLEWLWGHSNVQFMARGGYHFSLELSVQTSLLSAGASKQDEEEQSSLNAPL